MSEVGVSGFPFLSVPFAKNTSEKSFLSAFEHTDV
jgi:hypothetical protein